MNKVHLNAALSALALAAGLVQASEPPIRNYVEQIPSRVVARPPILEAKLGSVVVQFEKTTLQQVMMAASAGRIEHAGDAGGSTYWLCYSVGEGLVQTTVWLLSGEMGGTDHTILEVLVNKAATGAARQDCPTLPAHMKEVSLAGGLTIGMPLDLLSVQLGVEVSRAQRWWGYRYSVQVPSQACGGMMDSGGAVAAQVLDGRVVALAAHQVTSC